MFFDPNDVASDDEPSVSPSGSAATEKAPQQEEKNSSLAGSFVGNKNHMVKLRKRRGKYLNYDQQILFTLRDVLSYEQLRKNRDDILEGVLHFMRKKGSQDVSAIVLDGSNT